MRSDLTEDPAQWVGVLQGVVAVCPDNQGRRGLRPADEQHENVEGRFIGPVEVLQHQQRGRWRSELSGQGQGHLVRVGALCQREPELAPSTLRDSEQRPEGTRREERVAGTPQHPLRPGYFVTERTQEGSLAHSRFTADQDHAAPSIASRRGQRLLEHG